MIGSAGPTIASIAGNGDDLDATGEERAEDRRDRRTDARIGDKGGDRVAPQHNRGSDLHERAAIDQRPVGGANRVGDRRDHDDRVGTNQGAPGSPEQSLGHVGSVSGLDHERQTPLPRGGQRGPEHPSAAIDLTARVGQDQSGTFAR